MRMKRYSYFCSVVLLCSALSSCSKDDVTPVIQDSPSHKVYESVDLKPLRVLQSKGFFKSVRLPKEPTLRSASSKIVEGDQEVLRAFIESPEALEVVQRTKGNPFKALKSLSSYNNLSDRHKELISLFAEDSTITEFYKEALRYIETEKESSLRSYSQMLYSGPQHAEGSKHTLKIAGTMIFAAAAAAAGTPFAAGLAAGASYLLSLW